MKETVCVTGGSGGIGQALLEQLTKTYKVKALFRTQNDISEKWAQRGCDMVWGDIRNKDALSELVTGAKLVFHCAAIMMQRYSQDWYEVNVEGTRQLAQVAAQNGCKRFIHTSSAAVYNSTQSTRDYSEETVLCDNEDMDIYSFTKLHAEKALVEVAVAYGIEYTILRPTCVYGPNTKPYTTIPISMMRKGIPVIVGDGQGLWDTVYVEDVARALLLASESPQANGEVFNIGHETVTINEFYTYYSRMLHRPARHFPLSLMNAILKLAHVSPRIVKTTFPGLEKGIEYIIAMHQSTKRYSSKKAKDILGYDPKFTLSTGMLETESWLRHMNMLS